MTQRDVALTALSWFACGLLLIAMNRIGKKDVLGFYVAIAAELAWITWGCMTGGWALVAMSMLITAVYVKAILAWNAPKAEWRVTKEVPATSREVWLMANGEWARTREMAVTYESYAQARMTADAHGAYVWYPPKPHDPAKNAARVKSWAGRG